MLETPLAGQITAKGLEVCSSLDSSSLVPVAVASYQGIKALAEKIATVEVQQIETSFVVEIIAAKKDCYYQLLYQNHLPCFLD